MALSIRLARGGRKNRPFYRIVVADKRMPRDGRYIERLGTYNPLLANDDSNRFTFNEERIKYWLGQGAKPSTRISKFLGKAGIIEMPKWNETPQKSAPKAKTVERMKEKEEKAKAAADAAKEAEAAPAEDTASEAPAEEAKTEEAAAPAEEAKTEEPKEEAKAEEEKPAEEAKAEDTPAEEEKKEEG